MRREGCPIKNGGGPGRSGGPGSGSWWVTKNAHRIPIIKYNEQKDFDTKNNVSLLSPLPGSLKQRKGTVDDKGRGSVARSNYELVPRVVHPGFFFFGRSLKFERV